MYAKDFASFIGIAEKVYSSDDNPMAGVHMLYSQQDNALYLVALSGHIMFWERLARLNEDDMDADAVGRIGNALGYLPVTIKGREFDVLKARLKAYGTRPTRIYLSNVKSEGGDKKFKLVFDASVYGGTPIEVDAVECGFKDGLMDRLWNRFRCVNAEMRASLKPYPPKPGVIKTNYDNMKLLSMFMKPRGKEDNGSTYITYWWNRKGIAVYGQDEPREVWYAEQEHWWHEVLDYQYGAVAMMVIV